MIIFYLLIVKMKIIKLFTFWKQFLICSLTTLIYLLYIIIIVLIFYYYYKIDNNNLFKKLFKYIYLYLFIYNKIFKFTLIKYELNLFDL